MVRIIDATLANIDKYDVDEDKLIYFCTLMKEVGILDLEISTKIYNKFKVLPEGIRFYLNISTEKHLDNNVGNYKGIHGLIIPKSKSRGVVSELQINDIREISGLKNYTECEVIKIKGLDDLLCHNYSEIMEEIKGYINSSKIKFCPENLYHCATGLAVEWILKGGKEVVTSFTGLGSLAATEEVYMALRIAIRYKINQDISAFAKLKILMEEILMTNISATKPILGKDIFKVESGIHVDGIIKKEGIYEAYAPEAVGQQRKIVIGKHSGASAVNAKLQEYKMPMLDDKHLIWLLGTIKKVSMKKKRSISDEEFVVIVRKVMAYERS